MLKILYILAMKYTNIKTNISNGQTNETFTTNDSGGKSMEIAGGTLTNWQKLYEEKELKHSLQ